jgi:hypothetical protein
VGRTKAVQGLKYLKEIEISASCLGTRVYGETAAISARRNVTDRGVRKETAVKERKERIDPVCRLCWTEGKGRCNWVTCAGAQVGMLTLAKIQTYETFNGDIDGYAHLETF